MRRRTLAIFVLCKNSATGLSLYAFSCHAFIKFGHFELSNVITLKRRPTGPDLFEALVRPHFDTLYKAARRMTLTPQDAEDLVQEVCLKAMSRLDELENVEFQRAWLLKVMYNKFVDDRRRDSRSPVGLASTGVDSADTDLVADKGAQPDELVERAQRIELVLRAMRCLNSEHCAIVAMHDIEGISVDELCQLTGKPAGTIKSLLHRTRNKIGRLLSNDAVAKPHLKIIGAQNEL